MGDSSIDAVLFAEAYHEHGSIICDACDEAIDLEDAEDVEEAAEIWNQHVEEEHRP